MGKNMALVINIISSIVAFSATLVINFFLSPFLVKELGVEAVGFLNLATNFVVYASLVAIALNSMAGRFITIEYHQNNIQAANRYYSSVTVANIILSIVMLIPAIMVIIYLEKIINIPSNMLWDVKLLFSLLIINFLINTAFSSWSVATFLTNKIYLQSIRTMSSQILRVIIIIGLFSLLQPSLYYIGIGTIIATIYVVIYSFYYKRKLLPELRIRKKDNSISSLWELITSGIWNTILTAGQILLSGLDLLIANLFVGSKEMGMLALAKTLPTVMTQLAGTLASVFTPSLTILYAKGDIEGLKIELKKSMKLLGVILTVPLSILFVFGDKFYELWVPSEDAQILQILSILTIFGLIFTSGIQSLYNVFAVVNKIKVYSLLILLSGVLSILIVYILLVTTNLGIFAVASVSSFINLARNMFYTVPFAAKYLGLKWNTFIPEVLFSIISAITLTIIGMIVKQFVIIIHSWITLLACAGITALIGFIVNIYVVLNKEERDYLFSFLKKKLKKLNK